MTEEEWLAHQNLGDMIHYAADRTTDRKARLHSVAWCRRIWEHLGPEAKSAVQMLEESIERSESTDGIAGAIPSLPYGDQARWSATDHELQHLYGRKFNMCSVAVA